jgi:hypothetical protein
MKFHLDRTVVLKPETETPRLYKWSLNEVDQNDQPIGRDLIPWHYGLQFEVTELSLLSCSSSNEPKPFQIDEYDGPCVRQKLYISAKLRPAFDQSRPRTHYSMFGTSRSQVDFVLNIQKLEEGESDEYCLSSGGVGFTTEIDFYNNTYDDFVELYLYVHSDTFDFYSNMIVSGAVDSGLLRISKVEGFYSDWSPSIYTGDVKILTSDSAHVVQRPVDCDIDPPRLGKVGEVRFHLQKRLQIVGTVPETDSNDAPPASPPEYLTTTLPSNTDNRDIKLLHSLRLAAWIIAALLVIVVFK